MDDAAHPIGIGVVGIGNISDQYLSTLARSDEVRLVFLANRTPDRARSAAERFGVPKWGGVEQMLDDPDVGLVVNLTTPDAHAALSLAALESGRHVWTEKPLATSLDDGRSLLEAARRRGVRLGSAPDTFLGPGLQTGLSLVRDGRIGTPLTAFAALQTPGPDLWHPSPEFLFQAGGGPVLDIGAYYLTALVQAFGPIGSVSAHGLTARSRRTVMAGPRAGTEFDVTVPTHVSAVYEFAGGGFAEAIFSFDSPMERHCLEIIGTDGGIELPDPNMFDGDSTLLDRAGHPASVPATHAGGRGRGTGVVEMARALRDGVPHRASGELALHVLEALLATEQSARSRETVAVETRVEPAPLLPDEPGPADPVGPAPTKGSQGLERS